ncbi:MAG: hypothetical protein AAF515_02185 [Pseudomonadota bacterium]
MTDSTTPSPAGAHYTAVASRSERGNDIATRWLAWLSHRVPEKRSKFAFYQALRQDPQYASIRLAEVFAALARHEFAGPQQPAFDLAAPIVAREPDRR